MYRDDLTAAHAENEALRAEISKLKEKAQTEVKTKKSSLWKKLGKNSIYILILCLVIGPSVLGIRGCMKNDDLAEKICTWKNPKAIEMSIHSDSYAGGCGYGEFRACRFIERNENGWRSVTLVILNADINDYKEAMLREKKK
jgi:hypothetical protein